MKKLLLIDTYNFLHRAYHAIPKTFRDKDGNPTNVIYGFTSMLINLFGQLKPDYVLAALDNEKPTFRVENFTGYKAHRKPLDIEFSSQLPGVVEVLKAFNIRTWELDGYEADDIIGTACNKFGGKVDIVIVSNDRDLWQLVNEHVSIMVPGKGDFVEWIGEKEIMTRLGLKPHQIIDYKGLRGDPSDNIPGVHGVGEKTALKLVSQYGSIEEIYKNISKIEPPSLREKLANNAEEAVISKNLTSIITDAPFSLTLEDCKYSEFSKVAVRDLLQRYNFRSLIRRLGFEIKETPKPDESQLQLL
uniref:5'-3' exonuclease domain-containing protein n=1 Tax=candidate division WWE3 bacterium TaxID=2053526 RepID=A0A7C4XT26_UNCKA